MNDSTRQVGQDEPDRLADALKRFDVIASDLNASIRELTFVVKGLTGVLLEDGGADTDDADPPAVPASTYMDGVPVGS